MKITNNTAYEVVQDAKRALQRLEDAMESTDTTDVTTFREMARAVNDIIDGNFVTLFDMVVAVTSVVLTPATLTVIDGADDSQLTALVLPEYANVKTVAYASDNEAVATVDAAGLVTFVAPGTCTITVTTTDGSKTDTCAITVTAIAVESVSLDQTTLTINIGDADVQLVETVLPADASDKGVVWTNSDDLKATAALGLVHAVAAGETTVTVTTDDGSFTATCVVTVTDI